MVEVRRHRRFSDWIAKLKDIKATRRTVVILLCGGDKSSQAADIETALRIAKDV